MWDKNHAQKNKLNYINIYEYELHNIIYYFIITLSCFNLRGKL